MLEAGFMRMSEAIKKYPKSQMLMLIESEEREDGLHDLGGPVFIFEDDGEEFQKFEQNIRAKFLKNHEGETNLFTNWITFYGQDISDWLVDRGGFTVGNIPFREI